MEHTWTEAEQREHRRLWVEALRSGKYQQTTGCLHNDSGFCCLGVAVEISGQGKWLDALNVWGEYVFEDGMSDTTLPDKVKDWLGLSNSGGAWGPGKDALWRLNDDFGKTFVEIADVIESEPEGLFAKAAS